MSRSQPASSTIRGGLTIVAAMALIGLIDNFVPIIAKESGLWQFHALRSLIAVAIIALVIKSRGRTLMPKRPLAVALRSLAIAASMLLYFGSLALMPIAEAGAGLFSSPIFVLIYSALFFKTRVGLWRILAVGAGFVGVIMVLKPDLSDFQLIILFPLAAGMLYGLGQTVTRHWCSDEDTLVVLLGFFVAIGIAGLVGTAVLTAFPPTAELRESAPFFLTGWEPPSARFLFWTVVQAVGSIVAVAGLVRGYQIADPTFMGVFEYSFLLFAGIWGYILWRDLPDATAVLGICLIIAAGATITLRSRRLASG